MTRKQITALALVAVCTVGAAGIAAASPDERGEYGQGYRYAENDRDDDRYEHRNGERHEYRDEDSRSDDRYEHRRQESDDNGGHERGEHR